MYLIVGCPGSCRSSLVAASRHGSSLRCHRAHALQSAGSEAGVHGFSWSTACGIFLDQGSSPCPMHRQVNSYPLYHQGSPSAVYFNVWVNTKLCWAKTSNWWAKHQNFKLISNFSQFFNSLSDERIFGLRSENVLYVCTNTVPGNQNVGFSLLIVLYRNMRLLTAKCCFQWGCEIRCS